MRVAILLSMPLLLLACVAGGSDQPTGAPSSTSPTPARSLDRGSVPAAVFDAIVADAAVKAGVDPSAVSVVESSSVIWSDGSLGCPQPGMVYTQALVDGFRVILDANGTQYDYHGTGERFVLCPPDRAKDPIGEVR